MNKPRFIVGLTGGIATGKSSVARIFESQGAPFVDLDNIAREVVQPGSDLLKQIQRYFGDSTLTDQGELNRAQVRSIIFGNPEKKQWLESLLHPNIIKTAFTRIAQFESPYALLVAPLLIETGLQTQVDRVLLVDTNETKQIIRTSQRDTITPEQAQSIIQQQASRAEKLSYAQDVIENNSDLAHLERQVKPLHQLYLQLAHHKAKH